MTNFDLATVNTLELGTYIREVRRRLGWTLENLADEHISITTISNIEVGKTKVTPERITYLLTKLKVKLEELPHLLAQQSEQVANTEEWLEEQLIAIEHLIDLDEAAKGWTKLKELLKESELDNNHPLMALIHYIKGKYYFNKPDRVKARSCFLDAVRLVEMNPSTKESNIQASSYNELSRIAYYDNNLDQAIDYTSLGLKAFIPEGERDYYQYVLLVSKAIYLEKQNNLGETIQIIDQLWDKIKEIDSKETLLNLYELRISVLLKQKLNLEAISYAKKGLVIARLNKLHERSFELWTLLGTIYLKVDELDKAENCFFTALDIKIKKKYLQVTTYTQLSNLQIKQKKLEEAESSAEKAVAIGQETGDQIRLVVALCTLGDCHSVRQENEKAVSLYQKALYLAKQQANHKQVHSILRSFAQCTKKIDKSQYTKCIEEYFELDLLLHKEEEELNN